jgi:integrase
MATGTKQDRRRQPERFAFTERRLATLARPDGGAKYVYDAAEATLSVRLTPGNAVFVFSIWHGGDHRRRTIGKVGTIQLRQAREIARGLRVDLARGVNVFVRRHPADAEPVTLHDAFQQHVGRPDMRPSTRRDYVSLWTLVPARMKTRALAAIDAAEIKQLHADVGAKHQRTANKLASLLSVLCRRNGRVADNPASGIARFREAPRQRVLTLDELHRLRDALAHEHEPWRGFFLLALLTGSRRGALARMQWQDLDLDAGVWRVPAAWSKNGGVLTVSLVGEAVGILHGLHAARGASSWVFPSTSKAGHLTEPKKAWGRVCKRAGISGAVIHDLRRTVGTLVASDGANAATISAVLGHLSPQSARSYIHLSSEVGREFLERAARKTSRVA